MIISQDGSVIWPSNPELSTFKYSIEPRAFEGWLSDSFPKSYPVVFDSGRDAISAVAKSIKPTGKHSFVVPPYTSQCVVEALGKAGLISKTSLKPDSSCDFVYHQYGHLFHQSRPAIVEDSVDTLFRIGRSPFRTDAKFAIWSLRKTFGLPFGGIVWCRDRETQAHIRNIAIEEFNRKELANISLGYVEKFYEHHYNQTESRLNEFLSLVTSRFSVLEKEIYLNMINEGLLPSAIRISSCGTIAYRYLSRLIQSPNLVLRRHHVNGNAKRNEIGFFVPAWKTENFYHANA